MVASRREAARRWPLRGLQEDAPTLAPPRPLPALLTPTPTPRTPHCCRANNAPLPPPTPTNRRSQVMRSTMTEITVFSKQVLHLRTKRILNYNSITVFGNCSILFSQRSMASAYNLMIFVYYTTIIKIPDILYCNIKLTFYTSLG